LVAFNHPIIPDGFLDVRILLTTDNKFSYEVIKQQTPTPM